jgi:hypothetical protein
MFGYILSFFGLIVIDKREALFVNALLLSASPRDNLARSLRWKLSAILDRGDHGSKA